MINLTDKDVSQFQDLYRRHFGVEIDKENAREQGMKLVRLMLLVCKTPRDEESAVTKN